MKIGWRLKNVSRETCQWQSQKCYEMTSGKSLLARSKTIGPVRKKGRQEVSAQISYFPFWTTWCWSAQCKQEISVICLLSHKENLYKAALQHFIHINKAAFGSCSLQSRILYWKLSTLKSRCSFKLVNSVLDHLANGNGGWKQGILYDCQYLHYEKLQLKMNCLISIQKQVRNKTYQQNGKVNKSTIMFRKKLCLSIWYKPTVRDQ